MVVFQMTSIVIWIPLFHKVVDCKQEQPKPNQSQDNPEPKQVGGRGAWWFVWGVPTDADGGRVARTYTKAVGVACASGSITNIRLIVPGLVPVSAHVLAGSTSTSARLTARSRAFVVLGACGALA